ncbi:cytidylyltransferase domain-containing protein [Zhenhengia yiwuensis]|uniref:Acylneuraminate cytidylyltransferase n=1 Tax=Zhenhengia yiwuensis TaxID=2763666 RepID=A0A926EDF3_9FIRM|nr:GDSL-type esterase/lipase family protein [Zhenhengia yiwuensis]MBC8578966.1 acylneuraminate cytidylyltransferase [Zhenhengia yiwuensis]
MSKQHPICIIPARAGSKGLKNKNMLFLAGKPLILHTIDAAIESGVFRTEDIYVSTDSIEYKEVIEELRSIKVLLRKEELASDTATTFEVLEDFLKEFPDETEFMLCQPTSPLRSHETIKDAYHIFNERKCDHLVSFSESDKSLRLFSTIDENGCAKDVVGIDKGYRRQKQEKHYYPNGALYITTKKKYLEDKSFFTENTFAYVMSKQESVDVDDKYDFINVIGTKYFNYQTREQSNKAFYTGKYKDFSKQVLSKKLILGDSRMEQIQIDGFSNISVGGITLHTVCENIDEILKKGVYEAFIALGVNDLITGYGIESTKQKFEELVDKLLLKEIKVSISTIIYSVFRYEVQNEDIVILNNFIRELAERKGVKLIDPIKIVCRGKQLEFKYTFDGLHMNEKGNELLSEFYSENLGV